MTYVVIDFETTGLDYITNDIIEIAAVRLDSNFKETSSFRTLVRLPIWKNEVPEFITGLTGITTDDVRSGMTRDVAFRMLSEFIGGDIVVAQYAPFDLAYLDKQIGVVPQKYICTKALTSLMEPDESSSLGPTCERLGITLESAHRALDDARATAKVLEHRLTKDALQYVHNTLVVTPGRAMNYVPRATERVLMKTGEMVKQYKKEETE